MRIALIGMMGTLKTSCARALSEMTGMTLYDTDSMIEAAEGKSIAQIFALRGEEYFRSRETAVLGQVLERENAIISCGGGIILKEQNRLWLKERARVVRLYASAESIYERLRSDSTRPLLDGGGIEKIRQIMAQREQLYAETAEFTVDTSGNGKGISHTAAEIIWKYLSAKK